MLWKWCKKFLHPENSSDLCQKRGDVKRRCEEEKQLIISASDQVSEVHAHVSTMCTHISSITKIMDKEMVDLVLCAVGRPLMQLNVPKRFANLTVDARPKTTEEEQKEKLKKFTLPCTDLPAVERAPKYGPTWLLATAIWLRFKHKFLNEGTAKEACRKFEVREKQLSKILSGSKYKGGMDAKSDMKGPLARSKRHKSVRSHIVVKQPEQEDNDNNNDLPPPPAKKGRSAVKEWPN